MTATKDRFWAKVLFREFIRHFRKLNDEQIVADVRQSMDDLEDLVEESGTFGSKMVRWSMERADQYPMAAENGKKGGRPKKNKDISADAPTRKDGEFKSDSGNAGNLESATSATHSTTPCTISADDQGRRTGTAVPELRRAAHSPAPVRSSGPMPANVQKVYDFASLEGLDKVDAYNCWYATVNERNGCDADGNPVTDWKAFVKAWCKTAKTHRKERKA